MSTQKAVADRAQVKRQIGELYNVAFETYSGVKDPAH